MSRKKTWTKNRHKWITKIIRLLLRPYTIFKYGIKIEPLQNPQNRQFLIIMNHQTGFDQFFVGMCFPQPIYYIATEDIFSLGWISKILSWLVAPIPIKKQTTDLQAVKNCAKVAKEGGTIALAPEGNRTYSGETAYIKPSIIKLIRVLRLPVAIFRIEGGYGIQPRWSDVVRHGKMRAYVSKIIEPEEYKKLTDDELVDLVQKELYVNEACADAEFHHKKRAEYLERVVYVCPYCGLSVFESSNEFIKCKKCGRVVEYTPGKELKGKGFDFPFRFVLDWYEYQNSFVRKLDLTKYNEEAMFLDQVSVSEVILYKRKQPMWNLVELLLYGDRIALREPGKPDMAFYFDDIKVITVLGKNKLNLYYGDKVYQLKGNKRFNALKYVNIFYHYKNTKEGNIDGKFLGI